ncbi:MAG: enoyl-CoA hydratase/isomerase family protein [Phenylobacterium sp.]|uniref:enoyl-CoA hydratase/isomerase family protein n=1 Tax=Phenylobacterium sp. TaxID=1871053 RepID=UPI0027343FFE|nr:enoyl-CoA hydratase/isomerase family protein [Phenylobacterium sp.]MDP3749604.1 enoyl-CoA hydratase/isomerase family protein [Phenylobacterium sp.]
MSTASAPVAATTEEALVLREQRGGVTILTMVYRPYNLIGPKLMRVLRNELKTAQEAGSRAIVIRSGLRHFSAGADLDVFQTRVDEPEVAASADAKAAAKAATEKKHSATVEFLRTLELLPIPIVASVHGVCLGGGFELASACDYIVAAASSKIGSVEATLGLQPMMGAVQRQVQRAGTLRAKEMSMLGRRYDPATLERWGLINLTVPDEALESVTLTIAEEFANGPTVALAATKQLAYIAANEGVLAADDAMEEIQKPIWASEDLKAGLSSFRKNGPGMAKFVGR